MRRPLTVALAVTIAAVVAISCTLASTVPAGAVGPLTIMPLGDSITSGHGSTCGDGYRWDLGNRVVVGAGINATYVGSKLSGCSPNPRYEGGSGLTIAQIKAGVDGGWMSSVPDLTLLHIGVVDARRGRTVVQMLDDMSALLDTILARSASNRVIVCKLVIPMGINAELRMASVTVQGFNDSLTALAVTKGPRVEVADMSIIPTSSLISDGLHPNDLGYSQMAWIFYRAMARWYGQGGYLPWTSVPFPSVPSLS